MKFYLWLAQPSAQDMQIEPLNLPCSVESVLADMCNMCSEEVPGCWSALCSSQAGLEHGCIVLLDTG